MPNETNSSPATAVTPVSPNNSASFMLTGRSRAAATPPSTPAPTPASPPTPPANRPPVATSPGDDDAPIRPMKYVGQFDPATGKCEGKYVPADEPIAPKPQAKPVTLGRDGGVWVSRATDETSIRSALRQEAIALGCREKLVELVVNQTLPRLRRWLNLREQVSASEIVFDHLRENLGHVDEESRIALLTQSNPFASWRTAPQEQRNSVGPSTTRETMRDLIRRVAIEMHTEKSAVEDVVDQVGSRMAKFLTFRDSLSVDQFVHEHLQQFKFRIDPKFRGRSAQFMIGKLQPETSDTPSEPATATRPKNSAARVFQKFLA